MAQDSLEEDPRAAGEKCRVTIVGGTGIEWICIKEPHNPGYVRKKGGRRHRRGEVVYGTGAHQDSYSRAGRAATADQHFFVPRYPFREENR